jgi:hypothetical protein
MTFVVILLYRIIRKEKVRNWGEDRKYKVIVQLKKDFFSSVVINKEGVRQIIP